MKLHTAGYLPSTAAFGGLKLEAEGQQDQGTICNQCPSELCYGFSLVGLVCILLHKHYDSDTKTKQNLPSYSLVGSGTKQTGYLGQRLTCSYSIST